MPYKVYASLINDINSGWVWIGDFKDEQRSIVKITNLKNKKTVYCEALKIDSNFKKNTNKEILQKLKIFLIQ